MWLVGIRFFISLRDEMAIARKYNPEFVKTTKTLGILLYLFIIPPFISMVMALIALKFKAFFAASISFALFVAALYLSKKGFEQEFDYKMAHFAKAPRIPYKLLGAIFLAIAVFFSAMLLSSGFEALFLSVISFVGYYFWYGFDPKEDKVPEVEGVSLNVALQTLQEAKENLKTIEELGQNISNYALKKELFTTLERAKEIVAELEKKPQYISELRKFLVVYIDAIKDVTKSYLKVEKELTPVELREMEELLNDVQSRFDKELAKIIKKGKTDLDIKIDSLKIQINE